MIISRIYYRPLSRGDNTFGSVRVCACLSVSVCVRLLWALSCLNRLTLIFGMKLGLDLG